MLQHPQPPIFKGSLTNFMCCSFCVASSFLYVLTPLPAAVGLPRTSFTAVSLLFCPVLSCPFTAICFQPFNCVFCAVPSRQQSRLPHDTTRHATDLATGYSYVPTASHSSDLTTNTPTYRFLFTVDDRNSVARQQPPCPA